MSPPVQILGLRFFNGDVDGAVKLVTENGGVLVVPAAPALVRLQSDPIYRNAMVAADTAIPDSGLMVLVWSMMGREKLTRISGLTYLKRLLGERSFGGEGQAFFILPSERAKTRLLEWGSARDSRAGWKARPLLHPRYGGDSPKHPSDAECSTPKGFGAVYTGAPGYELHPPSSEFPPPTPNDCYVAPQYSSIVEDPPLVTQLTTRRPRHIIIAIGNGPQEKLGIYLRDHLPYRPAIHCIGAALGFLTGDQVAIPNWADRLYLGWLFRLFAQPGVFVPRLARAAVLPWLLLRYRRELPPLRQPK